MSDDFKPETQLQKTLRTLLQGHERIINALTKTEPLTRDEIQTLKGDADLYAAAVAGYVMGSLRDIATSNLVTTANANRDKARGIIPASEIKPWSPEVAS